MEPHIRDLESSYRLLTGLNLGLLILAGVIALSIGFLSFLANRKGSELIRAKDNQLQIDLKEKDAQIATASENAAVAGQQAAEANRVAEEERLARVQLEEDLAPRRITGGRQSGLATNLERFSGQTASLWYDVGNHEAAVFASDIARTLELAHWDVFAPASLVKFAPSGRRGPIVIETGVIVQTGEEESRRLAADAVTRELIALGFNSTRPEISESGRREVRITVKTRPLGPQGKAKLRGQRTAQQANN